MKCLILTFLLLFLASIVCHGEEEDYSLAHIRQKISEIDAALIPIKTIPNSIAQSPYGPGNYERFIEVDARLRRYEIHVPLGYNKERPWPAIINFHGGGGRAAAARIQSGMDETADKEGFIVIYPDGTGFFQKRLLTWNAGDCCSYAVNNQIKDVDFTRALLDDVATLFNIDPKRIYATGHSNGAFMAYRVACELSDRIAAIAPISGVMTVHNCRPTRPVPIIHFHGTLDKYAPYDGGIGEKSFSKVPYRSVQQNIQEWLQLDHIPAAPIKVEKKGQATIATYGNSRGGEIVLVTLTDMGHNWPGGTRMLPEKYTGPMGADINANDLMWDFFKQHPLTSPNPDKQDEKPILLRIEKTEKHTLFSPDTQRASL
jgi:polyhydroxybutyrate depolymerase